MVGGNTYVRQNSYYTYEMTINPVSYDAILEQEEILEVEENVFVKSLNMVDLESKWLKDYGLKYGGSSFAKEKAS